MLMTSTAVEKKQEATRHLFISCLHSLLLFCHRFQSVMQSIFPLVTNVVVGFVCLCSATFCSEQNYTLNILVLNWFFHWCIQNYLLLLFGGSSILFKYQEKNMWSRRGTGLGTQDCCMHEIKRLGFKCWQCFLAMSLNKLLSLLEPQLFHQQNEGLSKYLI